MSKKLNYMEETINTLIKELEKERKANKILTEIAYRHTAQDGRKYKESSSVKKWKRLFSDIIFNDMREAAISIFELEGLADTPRNSFNSKRLESQIFNFAPVCIFEHEYTFATGATTTKTEKTLFALPFIPSYPALDCYGEFPIVRPYAPSGNMMNPTKDWILSPGNPFGDKVVNENCVIITDFFEWSQTNVNTSMCINAAVRMYSDLIAECELAKKQNRNWLKIPIIFNSQVQEDKRINALVNEITQIVNAIEDNETAAVTQWGADVEILHTEVQYWGEQLEQQIKDYTNRLYNYLGIGSIKNETRARKITAEFEKTSDEYNINIIKRLQLREMMLKQCKKIFPQYFANAKYKVNLRGYNQADRENENITEDITDYEIPTE